MMELSEVGRTYSDRMEDQGSTEIADLLKHVPKLGQVFDIINRIGEGTFSQVYAAKLRDRSDVSDTFALKHIVATSHPTRIASELRCLKEIGGVDHVMGVHCCIREKDHVVVVMPYFRHDKFQNYLPSMSVTEVRDYIRALLSALERVHSRNIVHRDVKPSNFLYDRKHKRFMLVDFGLAHKINTRVREDTTSFQETGGSCSETSWSDLGLLEGTPGSSLVGRQKNVTSRKSPRRKLLAARRSSLQRPDQVGSDGRPLQRGAIRGTPRTSSDGLGRSCQCDAAKTVCETCMQRKAQNAPRAGTPGYRPPEILMKSHVQTCALDMWATGVVLLSLLSKRYPFFKAPDDMTSLAQIITILGSDLVQNGAAAFGKQLHCQPSRPAMDLRKLCLSLRVGRDLDSPTKEPGRRLPEEEDFQVPDSAFDLLRGLLDPNPFTRLTAEKASDNSFFS